MLSLELGIPPSLPLLNFLFLDSTDFVHVLQDPFPVLVFNLVGFVVLRLVFEEEICEMFFSPLHISESQT